MVIVYLTFSLVVSIFPSFSPSIDSLIGTVESVKLYTYIITDVLVCLMNNEYADVVEWTYGFTLIFIHLEHLI